MKRVIISVALIVLAVLASGVYYWRAVLQPGEIGTKEAYAILQSVEFEHRQDANTSAPIFIRNAASSSYDVLGLASNEKANPRVWIVLNKILSNDDVIMVPTQLQFHVHCAYIADLSSKVKIERKVELFLISRCEKVD